MLSACPASADPKSSGPAPPYDRIAAVERTVDVQALMRAHGIPGLSVAVIENFKIVWVKGYGFTAKGGSDPVTPHTLFMAGSISKPVTAMGALALVERGKISLESPVNTELHSWKVPSNGFTAAHPVTLGLLLDHTGGFTGGDFFPGYVKGTAAPTLLQILDGKEPATNQPVRVGFVPGSKWHYSGDGYLVVQQLMIDASGKRFPDLMRELVFQPLGMDETTFEQPISRGLAERAASGTLMDGDAVAGGWHEQPEMAAGGLWSTPADLARLAIEVARATHGGSDRILSERMATEMIAPHWRTGVINTLGTSRSPDQMGYGFFVGDDRRFGHIGGNVGYQAALVMFAESGNGVVVMTNSDVGLQAGTPLINAIARVYGWNYIAPPPP
jgi:CubicO group peptidase (beta-lactamase class C family)